jgi:hypothetical protein
MPKRITNNACLTLRIPQDLKDNLTALANLASQRLSDYVRDTLAAHVKSQANTTTDETPIEYVDEDW